MSVVLHLYVCLFDCKLVEKNLYLCKTPMYFNYVEYFVNIMLHYVIGDHFALVFQV